MSLEGHYLTKTHHFRGGVHHPPGTRLFFGHEEAARGLEQDTISPCREDILDMLAESAVDNAQRVDEVLKRDPNAAGPIEGSTITLGEHVGAPVGEPVGEAVKLQDAEDDEADAVRPPSPAMASIAKSPSAGRKNR